MSDGNYATAAEVIARIGTQIAYQLTSDSGTTPDEAVIGAHLQFFEGVMNSSFTRAGHKTPITVATHTDLAPLLKGYAIDGCVFGMHTARGPVPAAIKEKHDLAHVWLDLVAKGEVKLPAELAELEDTAADNPEPEIGYNERVASRANMAEL